MKKFVLAAQIGVLAVLFGCGGSSLVVPSGEVIIFTSIDTTNGGIYRMNSDGSGQERISPDKATFAQLSHDRTKIAYGFNNTLTIISIDGTLIDSVAETNINNTSIRWSPDDTKLVYTVVSKVHRRSLASLSTDVIVGDGMFPNWSPDGTKIVYEGFYNPNGSGGWTDGDITIVNADGTGTPARWATTNLTEQNPTFSPDGSKIAYYETSTGTHLRVVNSDFTGDHLLTSQLFQPFYDVVWLLDGSKVIAPALVGSNTNLWLVNTDNSGTTTPLTTASGTQLYMSLSPNGQNLAYTSFSGTNLFVNTIGIDGTGDESLTTVGLKAGYPSWR